MKPVDIRNENFEAIRERLTGDRMEVYHSLAACGPCTCWKLRDCMGRDNLNGVAPRVTELVQLGFVECVGVEEKTRRGIYQTIPIRLAERNFDGRKKEALKVWRQPSLMFA
jgi:hypothetical protein